jgi:hypothetical protein
LIERSYILTAFGVINLQSLPLVPKYDTKEHRYLGHDDFSSFLQTDFVRFFQSKDWQFKPNGEPSIRAMRTGDGKTVEPLDNLELLQALQTHGHAQFPDQMIQYMEALGAARG